VASWGVSEVGLLTVILLSFENQTPILKDGQFIEDNGELTLVAPYGTGSQIRLTNHVEGSTLVAAGGVKVGASLVTLRRNQWLVVEQTVSDIRIRLGKNAKALRTPDERKGG
jgi:hypothetical protein